MANQAISEIEKREMKESPQRKSARRRSTGYEPGVTGILLLLLAALLLGSCDHPPNDDVRDPRLAMRSLMAALEVYRLEGDAYPAWSAEPASNVNGFGYATEPRLAKAPTFRIQRDGETFGSLTTPIAYLTAYLPDRWAPVAGATFGYWTPPADHGEGWILWSPGPDGDYDLTIDNVAQAYDPGTTVTTFLLNQSTYDPSNGAVSSGDLWLAHDPDLTRTEDRVSSATQP
mgnify:CR=1 FL=1